MAYASQATSEIVPEHWYPTESPCAVFGDTTRGSIHMHNPSTTWQLVFCLLACLFVLKRLAIRRSWGQCSHGRGKRRGAFINDCSVGCGRLQQWLHTAIWDATAAICSAIWGSMRQDCGVPFSCSRGSRFVTAVIPHKFSALCWQGQGRSPCSTPKRTT